MEKWPDPIIRFFSHFGLTRQETYFVLLLMVITVTGALIPSRRTFEPAEETLSAETFLTDSLTNDSAQIAWSKRADTIRALLAAGAATVTIDSIIAESGDEPVRTVNLNDANTQELTSLPRVGPKLAARIIEYRNQNGPFRSVDELQHVKGIGKKMFDKIKPFVTVK